MFKIDSAGATVGNEFQDENIGLGIQGTVVSAEWLNAIQREIIAVLTAASVTPVKATNNQLATAIATLIAAGGGGGSNFWSDAVATTSALPGGKPTGAIALVLADLGLYRWNGSAWALYFKLSDITTSLAAKIPSTEKGAALGVAPLDASSKISSTYLPSYVDDVLEYTNLAGFPVTGETGKLYLALDTNFIYRWSGSVYVAMSSGSGGPSNTDGLAEGSSNLYHTTERVQDVIGALLQDSATIDFTYNDAGNAETVDVKPGGIEINTLAATTPLSVAKGGTGKSVAQTSDDISEGSTNLYHTVERVQDVIGALLVDSATIDYTYNDAGNAESIAVIPGGIEVDALAATAPLSVAKGGTGQNTALTQGLKGVEQVTSLSPAVTNTMYEYGTLAAPLTLTLPTGTTAFVIGVLGSATSTNTLSVIGVTDTYVFRYSNFHAVFYRAAGSSVVQVQYQAATLYTPKVPTIQKFLSSSGTYTTPTGVLYIKVRMVGGGGGGSGSGTGGATAGVAGGNTTFGTSLLVANGGAGALGVLSGSTGGVGGTASLGTGPIGIAYQGGGGSGGTGQAVATGNEYCNGGAGGVSPFGSSGSGTIGVGGSSAPGPAANTGAGGAGGSTTGTGAATSAGGGGGAGGFVEAIIGSPLASYAYAVGAAGTGGAAGTNGTAGSNAAAGVIIVEEYYQ